MVYKLFLVLFLLIQNVVGSDKASALSPVDSLKQDMVYRARSYEDLQFLTDTAKKDAASEFLQKNPDFSAFLSVKGKFSNFKETDKLVHYDVVVKPTIPVNSDNHGSLLVITVLKIELSDDIFDDLTKTKKKRCTIS